jgi:hypothetical protein
MDIAYGGNNAWGCAKGESKERFAFDELPVDFSMQNKLGAALGEVGDLMAVFGANSCGMTTGEQAVSWIYRNRLPHPLLT